MTNDRKIKIAVGASRKATQWNVQELYWSEFIERVSKPVKTAEAFAEYKALSRAQQDELKDVGGFVGGELTGPKRRNENAGVRHLITLDADHIEPGGTQKVINAVSALGCAYAVYSTRKHESAAPRLRIIIPLDIPCSAEEYEPVARKLASYLDMQIFDPTTFEAVRLMYWPSTSSDGEYVFNYGDSPFLSKDGTLALYENWRDVASWPEVPGAAKIRNRSARKQGDPLEKKGVVGAFCKIYDIEKAVAELIPSTYEPCPGGRYTFTEGSTVGGAVLYDDGKFLYSHHATDPAGGRLCNAFDLVRLHKFGDRDYDAKPDTPVSQLPSYKAMLEFAMGNQEISDLVTRERWEQAHADFTDPAGTETDLSWMRRLQKHPKSGAILKTIDNVVVILEGDPELKGRFYHDEFANRAMICDRMPWDPKDKPFKARPWADEDDAALRCHIEKIYNITGKDRIYDAMAIYARSHSRHPIREYLNSLTWDGTPRLDTLLIDYFGAEDNGYTRAVMRKTLVAAVARVYNPGCKFDFMNITTGGQGIGKSTFWGILGGPWYSDSLATFEGKDAAELVQGYWIIEAGELTGMNKSETNAVKQFLSKREDVYRMPYGKRTAAFPRGCIIVGTTNDTEFLKDRTGNRRFWPVDLEKQPITKNIFRDLPGERDQIWAEAAARYRIGEKLYLDGNAAEEAVKQQEAHKEVSPKEGMIREFLDREIPKNWYTWSPYDRRNYWHNEFKKEQTEDSQLRDRICAAEIWNECFGGDMKQMRRSDTMEINSILGSLEGWKRMEVPYRFGDGYGRQRGYKREGGRM